MKIARRLNAAFLATVTLSTLALFAGAIHSAHAQSTDNAGFDAMVAAGKLIVDDDKVGQAESSHAMQVQSGHVYTLDEQQHLVDENSAALSAAKAALELPLRNPDEQDINSQLPWLSTFRGLGRLIVLEGEVKEQHGDYPGAADDYLAAMHLGRLCFTNGGYIHAFVGIAIEAIARRPLWDMAPHADAATSRRVAKAVMEEQAATQDYATTFSIENRVGANSIPIIYSNTESVINMMKTYPGSQWTDDQIAKIRQEVANDSSSMTINNLNESYSTLKTIVERPTHGEPTYAGFHTNDEIVATLLGQMPRYMHLSLYNHAENSLLATFYALHAYSLDNHTFPTSLSALVPDYLARIPTDPFDAGAPIHYRKTDPRFSLYSIGPDGIDNHGAALETTSITANGPNTLTDSTGDMIADLDR